MLCSQVRFPFWVLLPVGDDSQTSDPQLAPGGLALAFTHAAELIDFLAANEVKH
jgi:hypothetical protein